MSNDSRGSKREALLDVGVDLFRRQGYHATGITEILEVAGVAKMTLYAHFSSKEELLLAAMARYDAEFRETTLGAIESCGGIGRGPLDVVVDTMEAFVRGEAFHGCLFINMMGEFPDPHHRVRAAARQHKAKMAELIAYAGKDWAADPAQLGADLMILFDGMIVQGMSAGQPVVDSSMRLIRETIEQARIS